MAASIGVKDHNGARPRLTEYGIDNMRRGLVIVRITTDNIPLNGGKCGVGDGVESNCVAHAIRKAECQGDKRNLGDFLLVDTTLTSPAGKFFAQEGVSC